MKILILNQAFYPDVASTAQHATDLAMALTQAGHQVTVLCSRRAYDAPATRFPRSQTWNDIKIERVGSTGLGKNTKWHRILDFASFIAAGTIRLLFLPRVDVVISLTSPPLFSFVAALAVPLKAKHLVFWCMDLNPDEAIAAGWLREDSLIARLLSRLLLHTLRKADRIIALDRFMKERIQAKGVEEEKITAIPPWSHDRYVRFNPAGRQEFRAQHGLTRKFVVMYSGNHSPCHPLETLLQAAERLAGRDDIVFCLVGGGSEFRKVRNGMHRRNVVCIPYQSIEKLSASLSAADLHIVLLGDPFVGIVHPCKIYNILAVGTPILYIGPRESHVGDILAADATLGYSHRHGEVDQVVTGITAACARSGRKAAGTIAERFSGRRLLPEMLTAIEAVMGTPQSRREPQIVEQPPVQARSGTA